MNIVAKFATVSLNVIIFVISSALACLLFGAAAILEWTVPKVTRKRP